MKDVITEYVGKKYYENESFFERTYIEYPDNEDELKVVGVQRMIFTTTSWFGMTIDTMVEVREC